MLSAVLVDCLAPNAKKAITQTPVRVMGRKSHLEQIWSALPQTADIDSGRDDFSVGPMTDVVLGQKGNIAYHSLRSPTLVALTGTGIPDHFERWRTTMDVDTLIEAGSEGNPKTGFGADPPRTCLVRRKPK